MHFITTNQTIRSATAAVVMLPIIFGAFLALEPTVSTAQSPEETFTVRQEITEEIAFTVAPQNVTMDTALQGLTGGTSNGSTTFEITTNNSAGYTMTIEFASSTAMQFDTGAGEIPNLGSTVIADFDATAVTGTSGFGYTITGPAVVSTLLGDTTSCGSGSANGDACWQLQADATVAATIVDSSAPTDPAGDEYSLYFRVVVDQNPSPSLPQGFYTATTTVTAINK